MDSSMPTKFDSFLHFRLVQPWKRLGNLGCGQSLKYLTANAPGMEGLDAPKSQESARDEISLFMNATLI